MDETKLPTDIENTKGEIAARNQKLAQDAALFAAKTPLMGSEIVPSGGWLLNASPEMVKGARFMQGEAPAGEPGFSVGSVTIPPKGQRTLPQILSPSEAGIQAPIRPGTEMQGNTPITNTSVQQQSLMTQGKPIKDPRTGVVYINGKAVTK